jgi:hypothetical protein
MTFPEPLRYVKLPPPERLEFLTGIDWFRHCCIDSDMSRQSAIASISSPEWEDFTLERRNDITAHLATAHRNREHEWNKVAKGVTAYTDSKVFPRMIEAAAAQGFPDAVVRQVQWDVRSFIQEEIYASWRVPRFFIRLADIYRIGHIPCGWVGNFPEGHPTKF